MADLSLDLNPASQNYKDFLVVNNDLLLTNDAETGGNNPVEQNIIQRLSMFLGEWFLDNTQGVPWFQQILVKNPDQANIDAIFRNIILGTPGVVSLTSYSFSANLAKRTLSVKYSALTTSGKVNYNGLLAPVYSGNQSPGILSP